MFINERTPFGPKLVAVLDSNDDWDCMAYTMPQRFYEFSKNRDLKNQNYNNLNEGLQFDGVYYNLNNA